MNKLSHSFFNFIILFVILICGIITFFMLRGNPPAQLIIGIVTSISYIIWGIIYHWLEGDLHLRVVIEYGLIGSIAIVLIMTVLGY